MFICFSPQQSSVNKNNVNLSSINIFVHMTRPYCQVQPEHHSSTNNYNRNAIRQWPRQWQLGHVDNNTAAECGPVIAIARWGHGSASNTPSHVQHLCHHDVHPSSNWNTASAAATTRTPKRSGNGNGNRDTQTQRNLQHLYDHGGSARNIISYFIIISNNNTMLDACISNTTMLDAILIQLDPSTTRMCGRWREEMYVQTMERGEGDCVGKGLDRGRVDVVADNRVTRTQTDNRNGHAGNHETTYQTHYWV